jgi:hypothetical protein
MLEKRSRCAVTFRGVASIFQTCVRTEHISLLRYFKKGKRAEKSARSYKSIERFSEKDIDSVGGELWLFPTDVIAKY